MEGPGAAPPTSAAPWQPRWRAGRRAVRAVQQPDLTAVCCCLAVYASWLALSLAVSPLTMQMMPAVGSVNPCMALATTGSPAAGEAAPPLPPATRATANGRARTASKSSRQHGEQLQAQSLVSAAHGGGHATQPSLATLAAALAAAGWAAGASSSSSNRSSRRASSRKQKRASLPPMTPG